MRLTKAEHPDKLVDFDFIKQNIDIVSLIQDSEPNLSLVGNKWVSGHESAHKSEKGRCLSVDPEQGIWHCFHCGQGGSLKPSYQIVRGLEIIVCSEVLS